MADVEKALDAEVWHFVVTATGEWQKTLPTMAGFRRFEPGGVA